MSPLPTTDEQRCKDGQRLGRKILTVSQRRVSPFPKKLTQKDAAIIIDEILDWLDILQGLRTTCSTPRVMIDTEGTIVTRLESDEQQLKPYLTMNNPQLVRLVRSWLYILQEIRWFILINDGLVDSQSAGSTIYRTAEEVATELAAK